MPNFLSDLFGILGGGLSEASNFISGNKDVNVENVANSAGRVIGDIVNRTGGNGGNGSDIAAQAITGGISGFNQTSSFLTDSIFKVILNWIQKNLIIVLLIVVGFIFIIKKK